MKRGLIVLLSLLYVSAAFAQADPIPLNTKQYILLNRLDIKLRNDSVLGFTTTKPYNRRIITQRLDYIDSLDKAGSPLIKLTRVDRYNLRSAFLNSPDWTTRYGNLYQTNEPFFEHFYRNQAHLFSIKNNEFFLSVNPMLTLNYGNSSDKTKMFQNSRGVVVRGNIDKRVGFWSSIVETQERYPGYARAFTRTMGAVPGAAFYKEYKDKPNDAVDYFDARGGINFNAGRHFDIMFGYDKLFIGNGYRSLLLSDFSAPYLFVKIDTRVWKLKYQNIFAEMVAPFKRGGPDVLREKKYTVMHHLSFQPTKWLNIGLFENIMFYRQGRGFDLSYANPIIFYRAIEGNNGSADKATIGGDFKANIRKNVQVYGQLLLTEFVIEAIKDYSKGSWLNKHGGQLGVKYIDAFGLKNLDLQAEMNIVRPFSYQHRDSTTSYSNYNQPLAHPLGAGFREFIFTGTYQPLPKLYLHGKVLIWKQGLDSAGYNFGSNVLRSYNTRPRNEGYFIGTGVPATAVYASATASYELVENLFIDANITLRQYKVAKRNADNLTYFSLGLRMNMQRREFDF